MKSIQFDLFSVQATLDANKTLIRLPIKPQPVYIHKEGLRWNGRTYGTSKPPSYKAAFQNFVKAAPYQPGDILCVKEPWAHLAELPGISAGGIAYKADYSERELADMKRKHFRWQPAKTMPQHAARLFIKVRSVQMEQLHESLLLPPGADAQMRREGLEPGCSYIAHWDRALKPSELYVYGWEANPYVWILEYAPIDKAQADAHKLLSKYR